MKRLLVCVLSILISGNAQFLDFNTRGFSFLPFNNVQSNPTSFFDMFNFPSSRSRDFNNPERQRPRSRTRPPTTTTTTTTTEEPTVNNPNSFDVQSNEVRRMLPHRSSLSRDPSRGPQHRGFNPDPSGSRFGFSNPRTRTSQREFRPSSGTHDASISSVKGHIIRLVNEQREWRARFVQIAFHDCVGGCDGCLNMDDTNNRGLQRVLDKCIEIQQNFAPTWSLADVIALCGAVASEQASINTKDSSTVRITYQRGRIDCVGHPPRRKHPEHHDTKSVQFLVDEFGVTVRGAVALLGSHSLGEMRLNHSGHGPHTWDETPEILDRGYYVELVRAKGWHPVRITNELKDSVQWEALSPNGKNVTIAALNADMALMKRFNLKNDFHEPDCTFDACPFAHTAQMVNQFNNDNSLFHQEYSKAFSIMINKRPDSIS